MHVPISGLHGQCYFSISLNSQRFLQFHPAVILVIYVNSCFIIIRENYFPVSFSSRISYDSRTTTSTVVYGDSSNQIWGGAVTRYYRKSRDRKWRDRKWRQSRDRKWQKSPALSRSSVHAQPEVEQYPPSWDLLTGSDNVTWPEEALSRNDSGRKYVLRMSRIFLSNSTVVTLLPDVTKGHLIPSGFPWVCACATGSCATP